MFVLDLEINSTGEFRGLGQFEKVKFGKIARAETSFTQSFTSVSLKGSYRVCFCFYNSVKEVRVECEIDTRIFNAARIALNKPELKIEGYTIGDYIVKVQGKNSFVFDNVYIPSIDDIRDDLHCKREPRFVLVSKSLLKDEIEQYLATENVSWYYFSNGLTILILLFYSYLSKSIILPIYQNWMHILMLEQSILHLNLK